MRNAQPWTRMAFPFTPYEAPLMPVQVKVKPLVRDDAPGYVGFGFSRPHDFPHSSGDTSNNTVIVNPPPPSPPATPTIVTARRSLVAKGGLPGMVPSEEFPTTPASTVVYTTPRKRERLTPEASDKLETKIREAATKLSLTSAKTENVGDKARRDQRAKAREARKFTPLTGRR